MDMTTICVVCQVLINVFFTLIGVIGIVLINDLSCKAHFYTVSHNLSVGDEKKVKSEVKPVSRLLKFHQRQMLN